MRELWEFAERLERGDEVQTTIDKSEMFYCEPLHCRMLPGRCTERATKGIFVGHVRRSIPLSCIGCTQGESGVVLEKKKCSKCGKIYEGLDINRFFYSKGGAKKYSKCKSCVAKAKKQKKKAKKRKTINTPTKRKCGKCHNVFRSAKQIKENFTRLKTKRYDAWCRDCRRDHNRRVKQISNPTEFKRVFGVPVVDQYVAFYSAMDECDVSAPRAQYAFKLWARVGDNKDKQKSFVVENTKRRPARIKFIEINDLIDLARLRILACEKSGEKEAMGDWENVVDFLGKIRKEIEDKK